MAAKKKPAPPHVPKSKWYSDGVPATDPNKPLVRTAKDKIAAAALKESRIEQIMALMMQFATRTGAPTWNRAIRKALGTQWKMTDPQVCVLSAEASRRVKEQVNDPDEVRRNVGVVLDTGLRTTLANGDWGNAAKLATVALKMTDGPTQVEVTVKEKVPTPADAAQAVKEMFGIRVSNSETEADPTAAVDQPIHVDAGAEPAASEPSVSATDQAPQE